MQAVANNNPELFRELMPTEAPEYKIFKYDLDIPKHYYFDISGKLANRSIKRFGYKLIYALYYHKTNMIAPEGGGVIVSCYTNEKQIWNGNSACHFLIFGTTRNVATG
jgi:hypothetical protein